MWRVFREVFKDIYVKLFTVLSIVSVVWAMANFVSPTLNEHVSESIGLDSGYWFIIAIMFLIVMFFVALMAAAKYRKKLVGVDNILLVYDEKRYPKTCRYVESNEETFRVGFHVTAPPSIESPVLFPSMLLRWQRRIKEGDKIPIDPLPLNPIVRMNTVHPSSFTPVFWVNVFRHQIGSSSIRLCYDGHAGEHLDLSSGEYGLCLVAQGSTSETRQFMHITVNKKAEFKIRLSEPTTRDMDISL